MKTLLLWAALSAHGCALAVDTVRWKEEVPLSDGRTVEVWREVKFRSSGFPVSRKGADIAYKLRFDARNLRWESNNPAHQPIVFDVINGKAFVVALDVSPASCRGRATGELPVDVFSWDGHGWEKVPHDTAPIERMSTNLYFGYRDKETAETGFVSAKRKAMIDGRRFGVPLGAYFDATHTTCAEILGSHK